ncbi:Dimethylglycine N-methyltransferase [compost metagenome]
MNPVESALAGAIKNGVRQFQAYLTGGDEEHASHLLDLLDPPQGAVVIDAGCGIGETARLMHAIRPDLRFILVNLSRAQLDLCPEGMEQIHADYCDMPLPNASADVVMFNYAACHCGDWSRMLAECRRVLRDGGTVFLHEPADRGADRLLWRSIGSDIRTAEQMAQAARLAGFAVESAYFLEPKVSQFHALVPKDQADAIVAGVESCVLRLRMLSDPIEQAFNRHDRVGLQFSGGRDSTATLYLLREYWPQLTVYHVDAGDQFPETRAIVGKVRDEVLAAGGRFEVIHSNVHESRRVNGWPTDLLPADNTPFGRRVAGEEMPLVGRYECCAHNIMLPMHQRVLADGCTLLIRGQRDSDYVAPPLRSGDTSEGLEFLYPIQNWSGEDVERYLRENGLPVAEFYPEGIKRASDCMTCTAWWDDGRAQYLRRFHPEQHKIFIDRAILVRNAVAKQLQWLDHEMEA